MKRVSEHRRGDEERAGQSRIGQSRADQSRAGRSRANDARYDVLPTLDWDAFAAAYWDRRPVHLRSCPQQPFRLSDVLEAAHAAATAPADDMPYAQCTIERSQQADPRPWLPRADERSFDDYQARLRLQTEGRRYALIVNRLHSLAFPLWARERDGFAALWRRVGLPLSSAITTLFHGNYEHSPVGVHQDRFSTFMFVLKGRKRMRFWPTRPWREPVSSILDYQPYLASSFAVEVAAGEALYWPASYYHVGESVDAEPATSVNVGVPRCGHRLRYDFDDLLAAREADASDESVFEDGMFEESALEHGMLDGGLRADGSIEIESDEAGEADAMPLAYRRAAQRLRARCAADALDVRLRLATLLRYSAGGFEPAPAPAPAPRLSAQARIVLADGARLHWTQDARGTVRYAGNGHSATTPLPGDVVAMLFGRLHRGRIESVSELIATRTRLHAGGKRDADALRALLRLLVAWRALRLVA